MSLSLIVTLKLPKALMFVPFAFLFDKVLEGGFGSVMDSVGYTYDFNNIVKYNVDFHCQHIVKKLFV